MMLHCYKCIMVISYVTILHHVQIILEVAVIFLAFIFSKWFPDKRRTLYLYFFDIIVQRCYLSTIVFVSVCKLFFTIYLPSFCCVFLITHIAIVINHRIHAIFFTLQFRPNHCNYVD